MGVILIFKKFKKGTSFSNIFLVALVLLIFSLGLYQSRINIKNISFKEFSTHLNDKSVTEIKIEGNGVTILGVLEDGSIVKTNNPNTEESNNLIYNSGVIVNQEPIITNKKSLFSNLLSIGLILIILSTIISLIKGGGAGKSLFEEGINTESQKPNTKFKDVAGAEDSKEAMQELVHYLQNPEKYNKFGVKAPKGVILYGPPGTGKTLLAKALAGEANCSFISVTGSNFVDKFVGNGAARVRHLFEEAKKKKPCIIFIDEIDAIGGKRNSINGSEERNQTLNELLASMNGFSDDDGIIVIGATNRLDTLDNALLRSGRFDTKIYIGLPDLKARKQIFQVHSENKFLSEDIDFDSLARMTSYFSGADIENVMNKAGLYALKEEESMISMKHINKAINHLIAGEEKKDRAGISEKDKKLTAYHEAGHAIVAKLYSECNVTKISIIPTTHGAGGYTLIDYGDISYMSKKDIINQIANALGGRAAEELIYGNDNVTTGASADIRRVTELVEGMIKSYGMNEKFGMISLENHTGLDLEVLKESKLIVSDIYSSILEFLKENKDILHEVANRLLENEVILESEFDSIIKNFHRIEF